jgi:hypothetical protein
MSTRRKALSFEPLLFLLIAPPSPDFVLAQVRVNGFSPDDAKIANLHVGEQSAFHQAISRAAPDAEILLKFLDAECLFVQYRCVCVYFVCHVYGLQCAAPLLLHWSFAKYFDYTKATGRKNRPGHFVALSRPI